MWLSLGETRSFPQACFSYRLPLSYGSTDISQNTSATLHQVLVLDYARQLVVRDFPAKLNASIVVCYNQWKTAGYGSHYVTLRQKGMFALLCFFWVYVLLTQCTALGFLIRALSHPQPHQFSLELNLADTVDLLTVTGVLCDEH